LKNVDIHVYFLLPGLGYHHNIMPNLAKVFINIYE
jgi:hypothetical protein